MDYQLEPRAGVINHQTDNARNNEILLNIIRASYSQPLNFVPISKASGTQTTDLKVGLPTFTLGPFQTLMEKQFPVRGAIAGTLFKRQFRLSAARDMIFTPT